MRNYTERDCLYGVRHPYGRRDAGAALATRGYSWRSSRAIAAGVLVLMATGFAGWRLKRALFGDASTSSFEIDQLRFGPRNTNSIK